MEPDYPAAHSMDTMWFAVDDDGAIARFDTGEGGSFWVEGAGDEAMSALEGVVGDRPPGPILYEIQRTPEQDGGEFRFAMLKNTTDETLYNIQVGLEDTAAIKDELASGACRELPTTSGAIVVYPSVAAARLRELRDSGALLWCQHFYDLVDEFWENPAAFGVYDYNYPYTLRGFADPYLRSTAPGTPLKLQDLPEEVQAKLRGARMHGVRFSESPMVQPAEHGTIETWGEEGGYLASDGVHVRVLHGDEQAYADLHASWRETMEGSGLVFEEPKVPPRPMPSRSGRQSGRHGGAGREVWLVLLIAGVVIALIFWVMSGR